MNKRELIVEFERLMDIAVSDRDKAEEAGLRDNFYTADARFVAYQHALGLVKQLPEDTEEAMERYMDSDAQKRANQAITENRY